jgi:hypothetical protein
MRSGSVSLLEGAMEALPSGMADELAPITSAPIEANPHVALAVYLSSPNYQKYARFVFAILSAIPWVGSVFAASAALHSEKEQGNVNLLLYRWLEEHEQAYHRLDETVQKVIERIEQIGPPAQQRLGDEKFLGLVRRAFRVWDQATTEEKREYVRRTVTNAAATRLCSDDLVRLFLQWIAQYDEVHFRVIKVIYGAPGSTRADIWGEIHGEDVRENSAEADLFKLIIRDLSTGSVIRQHRDTTHDGRFLARPAPRARQRRSAVLASAFDDDKPYELTELGDQFIQYVLNEVVPRLGA